jgi:starch-binding outer membrane protein, SusD/RagB family
MKNKLKWIVVQLVVIFMFGACSDDFFNEVPSDRVTSGQAINSLVEAELACDAPLAILQDVMPQIVFACDLLSDATTITDRANSDWQSINNHELSSNNPYIDPSVFYQVIININESLLHVDSILNKDQDVTAIDMQIVKGDLIGLRSWTYFTIARLYGEVAYLKDNLPELSEDKIVYISREAIMDTLINNLLPYCDNDHLEVEGDALYVSYLPMYNKALIGEIYLEKQDYVNATTYLKMAIEGWGNYSSLYKVSNTFSKKNWSEIFINYSASEVMSRIPFSYEKNQPNRIEQWYGYDDEYQAKPTANIINLFNSQLNVKGKETGDVYRGLDISYKIVNDDPIVNKYSLDISSTYKYSSNIILYRAADIHLLLAEAMNRSGNSGIALSILNDGYEDFTNWNTCVGIRGRVYLENHTVPEGADSVSYIEDLIVEERSMELAFEGKRWFDLMRVARRRGNSYLADKVAAKFTDENEANMIREKLNNEQNWYFPFVK